MMTTKTKHFAASLKESDPVMANLLDQELHRQETHISLIASENVVSKAVLSSLANVCTDKYAEGYAGKRYYGGCKYVDEIEMLAIERAKKLFNCEFANVQSHSGSTANQAVFLAFLQPRDTFIGMALPAGGHLTHGGAPNLSGKWFNAVHYGLNTETELIDYNMIEDLAKEHKPKLIISGASAYPRHIDFKAIKDIANSVGALMLADIAHYAGLIAGGEYPSPFPHADIVTSTTHKSLRGPRGGIIMANDPDIAKKINSAVFPGMQGGPLMNLIAAKAVAFGEALQPEFKTYVKNVIANARTLAKTLMERGYKMVTDGTDCHMVLVDLTDKNLTGKDAERALESAGIVCNKNSVPNESRSPFITSGIRLGSLSGTSRGLGTQEFNQIGNMVSDILDGMQRDVDQLGAITTRVGEEMQELCKRFPIY